MKKCHFYPEMIVENSNIPTWSRKFWHFLPLIGVFRVVYKFVVHLISLIWEFHAKCWPVNAFEAFHCVFLLLQAFMVRISTSRLGNSWLVSVSNKRFLNCDYFFSRKEPRSLFDVFSRSIFRNFVIKSNLSFFSR